MERLAQTEGLTDIQRDILATVRDFADKEIIPVATELEHKDEYPTRIVNGMKELGLFGLTIPEEYGGIGESLLTYALVVEQIARGWMSVSGIVNTHFIVAYMIAQHGTQEQKDYFLPKMAVGEVRGAFSMSEPGLGSDVSAITTKAVPDADDYVINGQKMWLTNGATANLVALLCRTDEGYDAPHRNMTTFLIEKEPGFGANQSVPGLTVPGKIAKMGYKGVDTTELILHDVRVPASRILGGIRGRGFYQMMDGVEVGRVNVAARGCGVALRAFELAIAYAQQRHAFGRPIAQHQAIGFKLAEMATKVEAAHQMMAMAARKKDSGQRNDLEAGMAKYLASEYAKEVVEDSFRIHGGYGYTTEYEIERLYREVPMLLIGEGTAEIQKMIISRRLLEEYRIRGTASVQHGSVEAPRPGRVDPPEPVGQPHGTR
jgi:alkylation response protein AidB-like acyl-CoA dehydrogenase